MASRENLMAFGVSPFLANAIGVRVYSATVAGDSLGGATALGPGNQVAYVIASNTGSGLKLPKIGGDGGTLLGDQVIISNMLGAVIQVYASNSCTITLMGASASGNTGVSVGTCGSTMFIPITATSWIGIRSFSV